MATRRQAASQRHVQAASRHVKVIVSLMPAPVPRGVSLIHNPAADAHLPKPPQKVNTSPTVLAKAAAKAKRQAVVAASRRRAVVARRVAKEQLQINLALTKQMNAREERAARRLNRKNLLRSRAAKQISVRHATGKTNCARHSVPRAAAKAVKPLKARRA